MTRPTDVAAALLLGVAILSHSYIDLELSARIGGWQANVPLADLAALGLIPLAAAGWLRGQRHPLPGLPGYLLLLAAAALSILHAIDPGAAAHTFLRKPVFMYVAYAFGVAWAARYALSRERLWQVILAWAVTTALVSLLTSGGRFLAGEALWFQQIAGLTPNHKTLAVSLAGGLPFLLARRHLPSVGLVLLAVLLSASKTAWLMSALAVALFYPADRPLALRWRLSIPAAVLGVALAYYAPVIFDSRAMLDAARSRHSLNLRAREMFLAHPLLGSGIGMSTVIEQSTFPHYRVNGVDAHGVIQKISAEAGLLGLAGYAWFTLSAAAALRRRRQEDPDNPDIYGALAVWGANSAGLLLSTETFSQTWWLPASLAWSLSLPGTKHVQESNSN